MFRVDNRGILAGVPGSKDPIVRQTEGDEVAPLSSSSKLRQARPSHWGVESIAAPEFKALVILLCLKQAAAERLDA